MDWNESDALPLGPRRSAVGRARILREGTQCWLEGHLPRRRNGAASGRGVYGRLSGNPETRLRCSINATENGDVGYLRGSLRIVFGHHIGDINRGNGSP